MIPVQDRAAFREGSLGQCGINGRKCAADRRTRSRRTRNRQNGSIVRFHLPRYSRENGLAAGLMTNSRSSSPIAGIRSRIISYQNRMAAHV